jgi:hypothetical protein
LSLPASTHDPSTGATILASWGDAVNAAIDYLGATKPRARVYNSANISIANNTATSLTFDSERYDVGGCHSTVTNTGRLTVPAGEGGVYTIFCTARFAANSAGVREIAILVNGASFIARVRVAPASASDPTWFAYSTDYALAAGDYVTLSAFQTSGGALNVEASVSDSPEFGFRWCAT